MKITLATIFVDDQMAALDFYTNTLGLEKRHQVPVGDDFWLTVVSPEQPEGAELLLEPGNHPAVRAYREAMVTDGIPLLQLTVDDVEAEHTRLTAKGVTFTQPPTEIGTGMIAVFDDTCGNLIQIFAMKPQ